MKLKISII